jgi:hypothetical protein
MDIKDLNKQQLILLTMLFSFVISIATGIVSISLMKVVPPTVPQTINRVIERTINNVVTAPTESKKEEAKSSVVGDGNVIVDVYAGEGKSANPNIVPDMVDTKPPAPLGQGVIISDVGLVLIENYLLDGSASYRVMLGTKFFPATVLKKFGNGFTILKINGEEKVANVKPSDLPAQAGTAIDSQ